MAFATATALTTVKALVATVTGLSAASTFIGAPESTGTRFFAFILAASQVPISGPTQILQREGRIRVVFGYRVAQAEAASELTLAAAVDDFWVKFYAARSAGTFAAAGMVGDVHLDGSAAAATQYLLLAGVEIRAMPVDVVYTERLNVA